VPTDLRISSLRYAAYMSGLPADVINAWGVDFIQTLNICDAIRKTHPVLFQGGDGSNLFKYQIDGNHDNQEINDYWKELGPPDYRDYAELSESTRPGKRPPDQVINKQIGTGDHRIHIERGHRYDWHNNDDNWWKKDAGFDNCVGVPARHKGFFGWSTGGQSWRKVRHRRSKRTGVRGLVGGEPANVVGLAIRHEKARMPRGR
jgi:hypothetical protein